MYARRAVHPCRRREHTAGRVVVNKPGGSSLQAQGTRFSVDSQFSPKRFIPAGAGNTFCRTNPSFLGTVHPCRRREHVKPHVERCLSMRFIPAGAGNTPHSRSNRPWLPVHPCRRREHSIAGVGMFSLCGSSLQAQGTQIDSTGNKQLSRFIPAGAGNTGY